MSTMKKRIEEIFEKVYGENTDVHVFFAPGRVNLIGEHTDYNGGHVLPCALTIGTYAAVRKRNDTKLRLYSENFPDSGVIERDITETKKDDSKGFSNYPLSVIWALRESGYDVSEGLDIAFFGDIPNCSGLSSSASVEVLVGYICKTLFSLDIDNINIALMGQKGENEFIGVNCGIMDQFAIAMGKQDYAIYLDTSTLEYEYIPVKLGDESLVITCSNKKRGLGESKYNERRAECEESLGEIKEYKDVNSLGELTEAEFDALQDKITNPVCRKRAKHAVYENRRTMMACTELKRGNITQFGKLMNESHISLKNDYEVTGEELDTLVFAAWDEEGVIGSRMTGAGFGGCTVSIVKSTSVADFIRNVGRVYAATTEYKADFYVVSIGNGPSEL